MFYNLFTLHLEFNWKKHMGKKPVLYCNSKVLLLTMIFSSFLCVKLHDSEYGNYSLHRTLGVQKWRDEM